MSEITSTIETVTVAMAKEWLTLNTHNRPLDQNRVRLYAKEMSEGRWCLNGDAIRFNGPSGLLDGQTRLNAVVASGVEIETFVVRGLAPEAQETMDRGKGRTVGDTLRLRGESQYTSLAAALVWINRFETGTARVGSLGLTPPYALELLERHSGLREMGHVVEPIRKNKFLPPGLAWALAYSFTQIDYEAGVEFYARLGTGADLAESNPIFRLRAVLLGELTKSKGRLQPWYLAALTIKAWNAWREGRPIASLRFRISEPAPERFPMPL